MSRLFTGRLCEKCGEGLREVNIEREHTILDVDNETEVNTGLLLEQCSMPSTHFSSSNSHHSY
jgi:hypothetical protein